MQGLKQVDIKEGTCRDCCSLFYHQKGQTLLWCHCYHVSECQVLGHRPVDPTPKVDLCFPLLLWFPFSAEPKVLSTWLAQTEGAQEGCRDAQTPFHILCSLPNAQLSGRVALDLSDICSQWTNGCCETKRVVLVKG